MVASILPRWRMMPASPSSRSTSGGPNPATVAASNPANTSRNRGRLRRMVSQDKTGLETLQRDLLEQALVRRRGSTPLLVVIGPVHVGFGAPPTPLLSVGTDGETVAHAWSSSRSREAELMQ